MDEPKFPVDVSPKPTEIEMEKKISEDYIRIDDIKLFSILDKTFFEKSLPDHKNNEETKDKVKQKLFHVIKTIESKNKNKKIKVEELHEKRVKKKQPKKPSKENLRKTKSTQPRSSINGIFRKSTQEFLKNIPKSRSERETRKIPEKHAQSKKSKNSTKKIVNSDLKSKSILSDKYRNPSNKPKPQFETKFMAQEFAPTSSDSEATQKPSNPDQKIQEKFRTVPKTPKNERVRHKRSIELIDKELALLFSKTKKKNSKSWKMNEQPPLFEKVTGDERDLPEIYFRFLRRSRLTPSNVKLRNKTNKENLDAKVEDFILGQILKDQEINYPVLDMINKTPFKYENLFENVKRTSPCEIQANTKQNIAKNITTNKKKIVKILNKRKGRTKSRESETSQESFKSGKSFQTRIAAKRKPPEKQIDDKKQNIEIKKEIPIQNTKKNSIMILKHDPINDNVNLSPQNAVTMMVLSAEKKLSEHTTYFRKFDHLQRFNTGSKPNSPFVTSED